MAKNVRSVKVKMDTTEAVSAVRKLREEVHSVSAPGRRLLSRKLWMAIAGIASGIELIALGHIVEGVAVLATSVLGYLLAQGIVDREQVKTARAIVDRVADGAVGQQVDDPTPVDGTEYERVERRNTNPRGVKTLAALAIAGAMLTGCAHLDGWGEADRAIQAIDGQRLAACQESGQDVARCMGVSVGSDLVRHLLRRGAEIVTRLIVARSGGGAEADSLTEAEAAALADELEHIRALLQAEGVAL